MTGPREAGARRAPLRVVTLTNLYPSEARPGHGLFVEQRMTRWRERCGGDLRVVAPVPWFPLRRGFGAWSRFARTPPSETRRGVAVLHPRVLLVPRIGMALAPGAWVRACGPVLRRLHAERAIDVLDVHYLYPDGVAAAALAASLGVPFVLSARGSDANVIAALPGPRRRIVEAASRAAAVVAVSQALADRLASLGIARASITVVRNGVDVEPFRGALSAPGAPLAAGRALLGVGRLVRGKGFHLVLDAMAALRAEHPDLHLVLAGEGPERAALVEHARALALPDRLHLLGEVPHDRIPGLMAAAHRFVLPSFAEGYPNVVVEAVAAGLPVVATRVGGIPEIVDDSVGNLAETPDAPALASALRHSLARTFDRARVSAQAEAHRWEPLLDRLDGVLRRAAETSGAPAP